MVELGVDRYRAIKEFRSAAASVQIGNKVGVTCLARIHACCRDARQECVVKHLALEVTPMRWEPPQTASFSLHALVMDLDMFACHAWS